MATRTLERPGTGTRTARQPVAEKPKPRLMPLRSAHPRTKEFIIIRYHSRVVESSSRGVNAKPIDFLAPITVNGSSLAEIEEEVRREYPMPNEDGLMNAFLLAEYGHTFPVHDQGGTRNVSVRAAVFYTLYELDPEDVEREYELDERELRKRRG